MFLKRSRRLFDTDSCCFFTERQMMRVSCAHGRRRSLFKPSRFKLQENAFAKSIFSHEKPTADHHYGHVAALSLLRVGVHDGL